MLFADFRRMITQAMVALGKQRDGIDVPAFQHLLKLLRIEFVAHAGDFFGGMKVEMNLAKTQNGSLKSNNNRDEISSQPLYDKGFGSNSAN